MKIIWLIPVIFGILILGTLGQSQDAFAATLEKFLAHGEELPVWDTHTPMPTERTSTSVVAMDEKIYVIGGAEIEFVMTRPLNVVEVYDTKKDFWYEIAPLPLPLHHPAAAAYDGKLYVVGGSAKEQIRYIRSTWEASNSLFIYDPVTNEWTKGADMPTPRGAATAQFIGDTMYVVGGANHFPYPIFGADHEWYSVNEAYYPNSNTWEEKAPMPTPREHLSSAVVDGKMFVIGGRQTTVESSLSANEVYEPLKDNWTRLEPMPTARAGHSVTAVNGTVFAFGGLSISQEVLDINEQYFPGAGWQTLEPLPIPLQGMGATTVNDKIYIIGGDNGHLTTNAIFSYYNPKVIPEFDNIPFLILVLPLAVLILCFELIRKGGDNLLGENLFFGHK